MSTPADTEYITIQKAADLLGVSTKTLRRWEARGVLVPTRTFGNQRRYLVSDIHEFQKQQTPASSESISYIETSNAILTNSGFIPMLTKAQRFALGFFALFFLFGLSAVGGSKVGHLRGNATSAVLGETDTKASPVFDGVPDGAVLAANDDTQEYVMKINIPAAFYAGMNVSGDSVFNGNVDIQGTITADNLSSFLTGVTAGPGISVGQGSNPTITNTGVISLGGKTGAVVLTPGNNITIDGTTISASIPSTNSFETIDVDGTSVTAGSKDTLKLVSGTGITLSSSGKTITITSSTVSPIAAIDGGTGQTTYTIGDILYADSATTLAKRAAGGAGQVLVMSGGVPVWGSMTGDVCTNCLVADPSTNQFVRPTANVTGFSVRGANAGTADIFTLKNYGGTETYFQMTSAGNIVLGNSTANTVAFTGRVNSTIEPSTGSQYDLGSSTRRWKTIYGDEANFTNFSSEHASISGTTASDFLINSDYLGNDGESSSLTFERGSPAVNASLAWNTTDSTIPFHLFKLNAPLFVNPDTGITSSGTAAFMVNQPFSEDIFTASASGVGKFVIKNSGAVGIGTTNPSGMMQVVGGDTYLGTGTFNNPSASEDLYVTGNLEVDGATYLSSLYIGGTQVTATPAELNYLDGTTVTNGGVMFGDGTKIAQDVGNFFWDDTNNRLGIGTTAPSAGLQVNGTTEQFRLAYDASNYSSFTVGTDGTLTLADSGNTIATLNEVNADFAVPTSFSAVGDVNVAYDIVMTNQNSNGLYSYGPLTIESGESFENNNLTLKTYGTGDLVADVGGNFIMQSADPSIIFDTSTATDTDFWMGIQEDAAGTDNDTLQIGKGTIIGTTPYLTIDTYGRVGIGTTTPTSRLQVTNQGQTVLGKALIAFDQYENQPIFVASASGTAKFMVDYTGNVGIGTTSPASLLEVAGTSWLRGGSTTTGLYVNSSGYVGIGATAPTLTFQVGAAPYSTAAKASISGTNASQIALSLANLGAPANNRYVAIDFSLADSWNPTAQITAMITNSSIAETALLFSTSGGEALRLAGSGNVGIGTTAPTSRLQVSNQGKAAQGKALVSFDQYENQPIFVASASGVGQFVVNYNGRVGIGTTNPNQNLQVHNSANSDSIIQLTNGGTGLTSGDGSIMDVDSAGTFYVWNYENQSLLFGTNNLERMRISNSGNVGIGTSTPTALLDVAGTASVSAMTIRGSSPGYINQVNGNNFIVRTSVGGDAGLTDRFTILNNGNVGIGTTNPGAALTINGTLSINTSTTPVYGTTFLHKTLLGYDYGTGSFSIGNTGNQNVGGKLTLTAHDAGGGFSLVGNTAMYNDVAPNNSVITGSSAKSDASTNKNGGKVIINGGSPASGGVYGDIIIADLGGNVGVGTTLPGYKFQVQVDASNQGHVASDGTWSNTSDARLKTNILTLESGLGVIEGLRPVTYNSISDPTGEKTGLRVGFIAQEVETILPQVVDTDPVTGYKSISYTKFIPYLTSAIQELSTTVNTLSSTTQSQQGTVQELAQKVDAQTITSALPYKEMMSSSAFSVDTLASMSALASSDSAESSIAFYENRSLSTWLTDFVVEGFAVFKRTTAFLGSVIFKNQVHFVESVFFKGNVEFNKNSAGKGVISKYTDTVSIQFEKPYTVAPIVSISLATKTASESGMFIEDGHSAVVTDVTPEGFSIHLPQKALADYEYNWIAIAVKDAVVTKSSSELSDVLGDGVSIATPSPSITPSITPTPIDTTGDATPSASIPPTATSSAQL